MHVAAVGRLETRNGSLDFLGFTVLAKRSKEKRSLAAPNIKRRQADRIFVSFALQMLVEELSDLRHGEARHEARALKR